MKNFALTALSLALCFTLTSSDAQAETTTAGYGGVVVFIGDGEYVPGSINPDVPGCDQVPGFCDMNYFWTEVVGFTPEEAAAEALEAKSFMMDRFGLDVDALAATGEITWLQKYVDPRGNYRAHTVPGQAVHRYGWEVHDAAFILIANVDLALGGEFEGVTIPPGSLLSKGRYVIEKSELVERDGEEIVVNLGQQVVLEFQSTSPVVSSIDSRVPIVGRCEILSSPWGSGVALVSAVQSTEDGLLIKSATRNVLTFDGADGLGDYPGVYNDPAVTVIDL